MVDFGMVRGGEACVGVKGGGCDPPWFMEGWLRSGEAWLIGVGRASICEVKSEEGLGVFAGRPRLRGPVHTKLAKTREDEGQTGNLAKTHRRRRLDESRHIVRATDFV